MGLRALLQGKLHFFTLHMTFEKNHFSVCTEMGVEFLLAKLNFFYTILSVTGPFLSSGLTRVLFFIAVSVPTIKVSS
jgi:hypothetical protein